MNFIDIHTHHNSTNNSIALLNKYPNDHNFDTPFSIGIHPWYISEEKITADFNFIEKKIILNNCYAIGECGLDKLSKSNFDIQTKIFKEHILLSEKYKKPLIIHCVKSFQEIIQLKKEHKPTQPWIIHGFSKNNQLANDLIKHRFFLSFGKNLLTNLKLQHTFASVSLEHTFLETDSWNGNIEDIYTKAAQLKEISKIELTEKLQLNFNNVFKK